LFGEFLPVADFVADFFRPCSCLIFFVVSHRGSKILFSWGSFSGISPALAVVQKCTTASLPATRGVLARFHCLPRFLLIRCRHCVRWCVASLHYTSGLIAGSSDFAVARSRRQAKTRRTKTRP
jgi:hypothetical protein